MTVQMIGAASTNPMGLSLLRAGSMSELRAASPLPDEAQRAWDQAVKRVARERLVIVDDLINAELTYPMPDWLGTLELYWEKISESGKARRTMSPTSRGEYSQQDRTPDRLPIYATMEDFHINVRHLMASQRTGAAVQANIVEQKTRRVNEAIEDAAWNGLPSNVAGFDIPGILNAPNANTWNFTGSEAWDAAGHTGEEILTDVLAGIDTLQADEMYGPYNLYVPTTYGNKLNEDFKSNSDKTIRQRLLEIEEINAIRVADRLRDESALTGGSDNSDTVVLIQLTSNVIDVVVGQQPATVSWEVPPWEMGHAVVACVCPRVMDTYTGQSGIAIGTPS